MRRSASTSFVLACIASNALGGLLSASPGGSCILGGFALLLLVFRVDTISNQEISLYLSRNCRSHKRRQLMMPFFNRTGLERVRVVRLDLDYCWTGLQALVLLSSAKTRKKKGRWGLRLWPLRCLSQFLYERIDRLLRGRMCCVPFTDGVAWYL